MIRDTKNLFRSLLATCIFSLEKYLFRSFAYFSIGLCCCCCWIVGVFYILWVLIPYQIYDLPISSPFPGFPGGSEGKASACNAWNLGSIPGLGRSPGEGNSKPLQYLCLENPMDRGAWWAVVHRALRVGHNWATNTFKHTHLLKRLSFFHCIFLSPLS